MREPDDATIRIRISNSDVLDKKLEPLPKEKLGWKMRRPAITMFVVVLMISVGWGAWSFLGRSSHVDDDELMTDVDGFESASPSLGVPVKVETSDSANGSLIPAPGFDSPAPSYGHPISNARLSSADVWLTGTIEDAEPKERIELPQRISGGPNDSSVVR